ncbi:MAG TPA: tetratricopeptide repeat protein [Alphaproteobacteria bacterium]|nr:tetratricopeptide repeat protein [Alphaproteobacteria bacterium]
MTRSALLSAMFVSALLLSPAAMAAAPHDPGRGFSAYAHGDFATALKTLKPLAWDGYAPAQYDVGQIYDNGAGVPQNATRAAAWYRRAAAQGYAPAEFRLGMMYEEGLGVPQNYEQAYIWLDRAARHEVGARQTAIERERDRAEAMLTPRQRRQALAVENNWHPIPDARSLSRLAILSPAPGDAPPHG